MAKSRKKIFKDERAPKRQDKYACRACKDTGDVVVKSSTGMWFEECSDCQGP